MLQRNLPRIIQIIILFMIVGISFFVRPLAAFTMSNAFYIIVLGNLNSIAGEVSNSSNSLTFTSGELGAGLYTGTNYQICAGFYGGIYCNQPTSALFTFSVTPTSLDFGTIDPTSPVIRTNILDVLSPASGYTVTAIEDHSLKIASGSAFIPDTTCDTGICSTTNASSWINILTYGFGYRCDSVIGTDCYPGFSAGYYKPFPNDSLLQNPQVVMQNAVGTTSDRQVQMSYKVNVSGSQLPGVYTNTITYIAAPNF